MTSVVLIMGQARTPRIVDAQGFVLKDAHGTDRALLSLLNDSPMLTFLDSKGEAGVRLSLGGFAAYGSAGTMVLNEGTLSFQDHKGHIILLSNGADASLSLSSVQTGAEGTISLVRNPDRLTLNVIDSRGFKTVVGNVGLEMPFTGESRVTSAASIRMFSDKGK